MPVTTQSRSNPPDGQAILEHVVTVVLKQPKDGPLAKALDRERISEIFDLLSLSQTDCDDLRYLQVDGSEASLSICLKGMLKLLKLFTAYYVAEGHPINDWTQVTKKDFDDFRSSDACITATEKDNNIVLSTPSMGIPKKKDLLSDFKKGIKRDASLFNVLKDPKQWDSCHQSTLAQAQAQDVSDVLNSSSKLLTGEQDFLNKNSYLYSVISSYWTTWLCGKIKKTCTVMEKGL